MVCGVLSCLYSSTVCVVDVGGCDVFHHSCVHPKTPDSQEEQANLLGELAMLRNYKHPHLVEFIGTAMAMERGTDTVRIKK